MTRAFICGCSGFTLRPEERVFLREMQPFGVILFKRNIETPDQVRGLIGEIHDALGRDDGAILVDQEGGRVQRFGPPHWRAYPSAAKLGRAGLPLERRAELIRLTAEVMAADLRALGVTIDCAPVLDVPVFGANEVIGDRAYGEDAASVARLARAAADGLLAGGVLPVMKHIPGHGRATCDSHIGLPVVEASLDALEQDFAPFRANADLPIGMTAHVVYTAIDPTTCATLSARVVTEIIRTLIGFDGLLLSDDLSMKALQGPFVERTRALFAAGVDIALHCNGDLEEARAIAAASPELAGKTAARAAATQAALQRARHACDSVDAWARIEAELAI